jgi:hypothetical protein
MMTTELDVSTGSSRWFEMALSFDLMLASIEPLTSIRQKDFRSIDSDTLYFVQIDPLADFAFRFL